MSEATDQSPSTSPNTTATQPNPRHPLIPVDWSQPLVRAHLTEEPSLSCQRLQSLPALYPVPLTIWASGGHDSAVPQ
jgi:hypothetical protein